MVALHNRKLSYRDVFPDNPWEQSTVNRWRVEFEQLRRDAGQDDCYVLMGAAEDVRKRLASQPSLAQMQAAFARIYPAKPAKPSAKDELKAALEAIRDGHNDPRSLAAEVLAGISPEIGDLDQSLEKGRAQAAAHALIWCKRLLVNATPTDFVRLS